MPNKHASAVAFIAFANFMVESKPCVHYLNLGQLLLRMSRAKCTETLQKGTDGSDQIRHNSNEPVIGQKSF